MLKIEESFEICLCLLNFLELCFFVVLNYLGGVGLKRVGNLGVMVFR